MTPFDSYSNRIRSAIQKNKTPRAAATNSLSHFEEKINNAPIDLLSPEPSLRPLSDLLKLQTSATSKLGEHPDFVYIKGTEKTEKHYITSVFIDIKGSTHLYRKYDLETIHEITNTIQKAAIHTCLIFGGHIQRLQGDGVFIYFGGKNIEKNKSVEMALNATSLFTYFVKNDLKNIFEEDGVDDIYTRIGIDFGDDDKVLWGNYGLGPFSELTTTSLHTSLASKMQSHAVSNGIVVGDNVKKLIKMSDELFSFVTDTNGTVSTRYIFIDKVNNFYYSQYRFDWFKYLKGLSFIKTNDAGTIYVFDAEKAERERQEELRKAAELIKANVAHTNKLGEINGNSSGVKNQQHRFHYEG